jgi:hypothetical protein
VEQGTGKEARVCARVRVRVCVRVRMRVRGSVAMGTQGLAHGPARCGMGSPGDRHPFESAQAPGAARGRWRGPVHASTRYCSSAPKKQLPAVARHDLPRRRGGVFLAWACEVCSVARRGSNAAATPIGAHHCRPQRTSCTSPRKHALSGDCRAGRRRGARGHSRGRAQRRAVRRVSWQQSRCGRRQP